MSFHGFRGQHSGKAPQSGNWSQARERHDVHTFDQFGREYYFSAENATGMPCSPIQPLFAAPFHLDAQYYIVNPDNTTELYADTDSYIRDRVIAMKEFHRTAVEKASKKGWPIPKLGEYSDDIIAEVGRPPRAYQLGIAMKQENPWVLGFSSVPDPRLVEFLENPTRELDDTIEHYDFGASSYQNVVRGNQRGTPTITRPKPKPKPARFTDFANLSQIAQHASLQPDAAELPVGEGVAEEDIGEEIDEETEAAFGDMGTDTDETQIESLPDEAEGAEAHDETTEDIAIDDPAFDALLDIEEEIDSAAAPTRVKPQNTDRATRQGARRPSQTAVPKKRAAARGAGKTEEAPPRGRVFRRDGRKSLADGARPVIADG